MISTCAGRSQRMAQRTPGSDERTHRADSNRHHFEQSTQTDAEEIRNNESVSVAQGTADNRDNARQLSEQHHQLSTPTNAPENEVSRRPRLSSGFPGTRKQLLKYVEDNAQILNSAKGCDALRRAMVEWFPLLGNKDGANYACPICSGHLDDPAGCGHCSLRCCSGCLTRWVLKQMTEGRQSSCPQCRVELTIDTIQLDEELRTKLHEEPTFSDLVAQVQDAKQEIEMLWRHIGNQDETIDRLQEAIDSVGGNHPQGLQHPTNPAMAPARFLTNSPLRGEQFLYHPTPSVQPPAAPGPYTSFMAERNDPIAPMPIAPGTSSNNSGFPRLRFVVGDRVLCRIGPEPSFPISRWVPGRVIQQWYRDAPNYCAPYLVRLDDGRHTVTPLDNDFVIRRYVLVYRDS